MALGFRATRSNGRRLLCHGGDGSGFTNFFGLYPDDGIAVVLTLNRGGVQAARSVIANTVLAIVSGADGPGLTVPVGVATTAPADGVYASSFWDIEIAVEESDGGLTTRPLSGLVISDGSEPSTLTPVGDRKFAADGGMFNGFEVTVGEDGALYGGLYPYRFARTGDVSVTVEEPVDETADLTGAWSGTITTPMGALAIGLEVTGPAGVTINTPFAQGLRLEDALAERGRLSGRFVLTVPTVGDMTMHPRLEVRGGKLKGLVYAQGWFGELPMPAELAKA
jgi:hypothetical protein